MLCVMLAVLLFSCFEPGQEPLPPLYENVPILGGEQRLILENGTWELLETDEDTSIVIEFDYYVSSDTCVIDGYCINWRNGFKTSGGWDPPLILIGGRKYSISDSYQKRMWGADVTLDPVISMQGYEVGKYPDIVVQTIDTLILK